MTTIFRPPVFVAVYALPKAQPEYTVNLRVLYAPNPDRPFRQLDWPLAARPKPPQDAAAPANLNPLIYPNPRQPFHQAGWDRPAPALPSLKSDAPVSVPAAAALAPFNQGLWENSARTPQSLKSDASSGVSSLYSPNPTSPFNQYEWRTTARAQLSLKSDSYRGASALYSPNPAAPFTQPLWENAASQKSPAKVDTVSLLLPLYSPFKPFVNSTEARTFARQDVKSDIFVNFFPLRAVAPFSQDDWPLAILAARSFDNAGVMANAILPGNAPATSSTDQFTVSGRSVQDLFTPSALSYPSHVTRQTN